MCQRKNIICSAFLQELSLYNELSIRESLNFYGRIYGMDMEDLRESTKFLVDFLDLPRADRRVGSLR